MLSLFRSNPDEHLKRAQVLLREANMARIEHQAAAEHHGALAEMYAQRVARLEREIDAANPLAWKDEDATRPLLTDEANVRHYPFKKAMPSESL